MLAALIVLVSAMQAFGEDEHLRILQRDWAQCLIDRATNYARLSEPAESIARAAFGSCLEQERLYQTYLGNISRQSLPETSVRERLIREHMAYARASMSEHIVGHVMDVRIARSAPMPRD